MEILKLAKKKKIHDDDIYWGGKWVGDIVKTAV